MTEKKERCPHCGCPADKHTVNRLPDGGTVLHCDYCGAEWGVEWRPTLIITLDKDWQIRKVHSMEEYRKVKSERYIKRLTEKGVA